VRVLLIDDSDIALEFQQQLLQRYGFEVRCCATLDDIDRELDGWRPQVIVSDVDLPEAAETDVVALLRTSERTSGLPILLCSGLALGELERVAAEAGADGFVSKSDNIEALPAEVRRLVPGD
jgi:DNA-binding response OmpR family regulator